MMDFCGVVRQTAEKWMSNNEDCPLPKGETLFKFMCYLDLHGYKVIEFERMPKVLRNFAELFGYGVVTVDQAFELVGYNDSSQLYQVLNEKEGISKEKESRMWEVWKEKRDELEKRKRQAFDTSRLEILFKTTQTAEPIEQQVLALASPADSEALRRSATLHILQGVLTLLDEGLFDKLSYGEITNLRRSNGQTILRLFAHLSQLSSKLITTEKG